MPRRPSALFGILAALILLLAALPLAPFAAAVTLRASQTEGDSYESPEFGYVVEWTGDWAARERDFVSDPDFGDSMILSNNSGRIRVVGVEAGASPSDALDTAVSSLVSADAEVEIVADNASAAVPSREVLSGQNHALVELHEVDGALVAVSLFARQRNWDEALSLAQTGVTLNGTAVFSGEPATSLRAEHPEEAEPVDDTNATPVAETPGEVWTSAAYGYSVAIPSGWTIESETDDTLALTNGTSLVTVSGQTSTDDLATCVGIASAAFAESAAVSDLRIATTSTGDRFQGSDARSAFALFTYTGDDGAESAYFVRCSSIEEGESVLVVSQQVPMADYQAERAARRQIETAIGLP